MSAQVICILKANDRKRRDISVSHVSQIHKNIWRKLYIQVLHDKTKTIELTISLHTRLGSVVTPLLYVLLKAPSKQAVTLRPL